MKYFVYVLYNFNTRRFYIGYTTNLKRRLKEHQQAKLSHRNKDFKTIFVETFFNKEDAKRRENYLKSSKGKSTLRAMLKETMEII